MVKPVLRVALIAGVVAVAAGCGPKSIDYSVNIVSTVCDQTLDPFDGVNFVQIRVSGAGLDAPIIAQSARSDAKLEIPQIPAGVSRVIEVRGYANDPSGGTSMPISIGRSLPFTIPDVITDTNMVPEINIYLRKVDTFTPPSSAADPHDCAMMRSARAGHTATLLSDGRVFIAGGYVLSGGDGGRVALSSTEFYNPNTGAFEDAPRMALAGGASELPKAFHTATLNRGSDGTIENESVVLHGGESYSLTTGVAAPNSATLVFAPAKNLYGLVGARDTSDGGLGNVARSHHLAVVVGTGQILIVGGISRAATSSVAFAPVPYVEWYDPTNAHMNLVSDELFPRVDATATVVQDGGLVAIAGGVDDAGTVLDTVTYFAWTGTTFQRSATTQRMMTPRRGAVAATLSDDSTIFVMGGYSDAVNVSALDSTEVIRTSTNMVDFGPTIGPRGDICAALLQQGTVMAIGGRTTDNGATAPRSDGTATLISFNSGTGALTPTNAASLSQTRWSHTCTTLADGTILVTGGVTEGGGTETVLQDAWIYTPIPGE